MNKTRLSTRDKIKLAFMHAGLIIGLILILFPAYWVLMASFKEGGSLFSQELFPRHYTLDNYKKLLGSPMLGITDVVKWDSFLKGLKTHDSPASEKVWEGLDASTRSLVESLSPDAEISRENRIQIVSGLNREMQGKGLYSDLAFKSLDLSMEAGELLKKGADNLGAGETQQLNRMLVEAAFPGMIEKWRPSLFLTWMANTLVLCVCSSLLALVVTVTAGYAFSRMRFAGRKWGLMTMIVIQMFPAAMAMVAIYKLLLCLSNITGGMVGLNTISGLVLVYAGGGIPFNTWIIKGYLDGLPKALEESAYIDGATQTQAFLKVILPLLMPILAVVTIFNFIGPYADFLFPSIVLTGETKFTLAVGMRSFIAGSFATNWSQFAAASIIGALPILVIFFSMQRFLVEGLTKGALKG